MPQGGRLRDTRSLQRGRYARRAEKKRLLIVCEGSKTEPTYFKNLWRTLRPGSTHLETEVSGAQCGSAPINVVDYALRRMAAHSRCVDEFPPFDQIWCVIDHDQHASLGVAMGKANSNGLCVALSVPCFELWYLLHFTYTTRPFGSCAEIVRVLKRHMPTYEKCLAYPKLAPLLDNLNLNLALDHAARLRDHNSEHLPGGLGGTGMSVPNPSTDVDLLVRVLLDVRD